MSYVVQVISHFRTYNVLLENGIPSVLELVQTAKPPVASMQSDRSVRTYSEMGAKVVRCIAHEEDLKREFLEMERVLAAIDPKYADLLVNFYCLGRSKSDSLKSGGHVHRDAFKYAQALFAVNHSAIDFGQSDFDAFCRDIKCMDGLRLSVNDVEGMYSDFKKRVMENPVKFTDHINGLPALHDIDNSFYTETTQNNRQFFRSRNTLLVALFYTAHPWIDFSVICDILKSEQGAKRYLSGINRSLHPEVL